MANFCNGTVSVVIPCHNAEVWVRDAIHSALTQTEEVAEVIVVDDQSTDGSRGIIRSFGDKLHFLEGEWGNGNVARNQGLKQARTEWIQFLDADDLLQPNKIHSQLEQATNQAQVVIGPLITRHQKHGSAIRNSRTLPRPGEDLFEQWLRWEVCQTGAALWKTEALRSLGGWNEEFSCCQDNELTMRALQAGLIFQMVDGDAAIYRIWSEETVCRKNPRAVIRQRTLLMDEMMDWLERRGLKNAGHLEAASLAGFEMARSLAKLSISEASSYASDRKACGLFSMGGPAGPASFQWIVRVFGYANAERIAALLRRRKFKRSEP